jgi:hypothetical protein
MVLCTGHEDDKVCEINFLEKEKCEHTPSSSQKQNHWGAERNEDEQH